MYGKSEESNGVRAESNSTSTAALAVYQLNTAGSQAALLAKTAGKGLAGMFEGPVKVAGKLRVDGDIDCYGDIKLVGADLAEQFDLVGRRRAEPGAVVVLDGGNTVRISDKPYDTRVAGVVSGAGDYRPGLVLDNRTPDPGVANTRVPLALTGKVWVLVDAEEMEVRCGDLLTTSPTPGHAMRATDPMRAFGAVLGKALDNLPRGRGPIRALVALQ